MNKRIQERLVEAHRQTKGGIYNGHPSEWSEKFAELIVKECMDYASRNWEHGHLLAQDLKTHFGVEE